MRTCFTCYMAHDYRASQFICPFHSFINLFISTLYTAQNTAKGNVAHKKMFFVPDCFAPQTPQFSCMMDDLEETPTAQHPRSKLTTTLIPITQRYRLKAANQAVTPREAANHQKLGYERTLCDIYLFPLFSTVLYTLLFYTSSLNL